MVTRSKSTQIRARLSELLREQRLKKGLSQGDLAKLMGYESPQYVSDWERAYSPVPLKKLHDLAKHLELDADKLFALFVDFATDRLKHDLTNEYRSLSSRKRKRT